MHPPIGTAAGLATLLFLTSSAHPELNAVEGRIDEWEGLYHTVVSRIDPPPSRFVPLVRAQNRGVNSRHNHGIPPPPRDIDETGTAVWSAFRSNRNSCRSSNISISHKSRRLRRSPAGAQRVNAHQSSKA